MLVMTTHHRLIYLIGAPGAGKSTMMAHLTDCFDREHVPGTDTAPAYDLLKYTDGEVAGVELGKRRPKFSGTDALPASIIEKAIPWLNTKPFRLVFAEGARLANKRFLDAAVAAGYEVHLGWLNHPDVDAWRAARSAEVGKVQSESWVKGRVTAVTKLVENYINRPERGVKVYVGGPEQLTSDMEHLLG